MSPLHSVALCPICGGGLCGVRICGADRPSRELFLRTGANQPHGLVVCDECEAIWLDPDVRAPHQYPDSDDPRCPICSESLWSPHSRWADQDDLHQLGWQSAINPNLTTPLGDLS